MKNYTEEFTKKVLAKVDIVRLINQYTKLQKLDNHYVGDCVFHNGSENSLVVYPDKQVFLCLDCGVGGNAAVFLMEKKQVPMSKAIEELARMTRTMPTEQDIEKEANAILKTNLYNIYQDTAFFYQKRLREEDGTEALNYLKNRELTEDTIETFKLGYSPAKGNALYKFLKKKGYSEELMLESGLIKMTEDDKYYDMFRGRVMFPIIDGQNRVIAFSGRVLETEGKVVCKYINSSASLIFDKSSTLYGINDVKGVKANYFILCEGQMDVIALHQAGVRNAVAGMGTAFTQRHANELKKYVPNAILSYDGDEAGKKAALSAINTLNSTNMGIKVLSMDPYKDPDEFIKALGKDEYMSRVRRSFAQEDFIISKLAEQFDLKDPEQKHDFLMKTVNVLMDHQERQLNREQVVGRTR